ncbi:hypothetical protein HX37_10470 [Salmonella enterica]|uniref:Uncharacterized protein n=1 Tax=Salmonella enterica TaxID=28901 RepID=A0A5U2F157_SALER|nr:hypothetical protein [Salmonella enterica]HAK1935932.1 hypothetical protein [Salmonella enterica]
MIAPNLTLKEKVLAGAIFLRKYAEALAEDKNPMLRISATPHCIAADAIELMAEENEKLRAQLIAFQKAANPAVAVDPAAPDGERTCHTTFVKGLRVCLRYAPSIRGKISGTRFDKTLGHLAFVYFESPFETDRWMRVKHLELVPHPDK